MKNLKSVAKQLQNELNVTKDEKSPRSTAENEFLKKEIYRLNVALSEYQKKYPSETSSRTQLEGLPRKGPTPIWLVS